MRAHTHTHTQIYNIHIFIQKLYTFEVKIYILNQNIQITALINRNNVVLKRIQDVLTRNIVRVKRTHCSTVNASYLALIHIREIT